MFWMGIWELFLIVTIFFIISIPIHVLGLENFCDPETTILNTQTGQCVPLCGEGTAWNEESQQCQEEDPWDSIDQIETIAIGIIAGVIATGFGIIWTVYQRIKESKKEDLESIQSFGKELQDLMNEERNLKTQLDCSLYVERYLDTLEQISSLYAKSVLRKNVADFFENQFSYGVTLLKWYEKEIFNQEEQEKRWTELRKYCEEYTDENGNKSPIEAFDKDVLPELMTKNFEIIPQEDGLSKGELVEMIRGFGREIDEVASKEGTLTTKLDCSLFVEQYLDRLEQIASLYRRNVVPKRAADYFENKFCYGLTLLEWYTKHVFKTNEQENRWTELRKYCEEYTDENGNKSPIEAFDKDVLPEQMLDYNNLDHFEGWKR